MDIKERIAQGATYATLRAEFEKDYAQAREEHEADKLKEQNLVNARAALVQAIVDYLLAQNVYAAEDDPEGEIPAMIEQLLMSVEDSAEDTTTNSFSEGVKKNFAKQNKHDCHFVRSKTSKLNEDKILENFLNEIMK